MRLYAGVAIGAGVCVLLFLLAYLYGYMKPDRVLLEQPQYRSVQGSQVAILIACHNGASTIGETVRAALANRVPVYVVSDASSDETARVARAAGACVFELLENVGKPVALHKAYEHFRLGKRFRAVAILDDDVQIESDFVRECLRKLTTETVIVVGKNLTWWPKSRRWNMWLAGRAYSYWHYQLVIRRLQSRFNVMNCISGSNSIYRTELLDMVLHQQPPYIVDDTYWLLEAQRRRLGRVVFVPRARAHLQDPTDIRSWYRQNIRWMWGTYQGIIGHRVGRRLTAFDFAYLLLMSNWLLYVAETPLLVWVFYKTDNPGRSLLWLAAGYTAWIAVAAWRLRVPRLVLFMPLIVLTDMLYRIIMVHALIKAIRQPTVSRCVWESPARISTATQGG